MPRKYLTQDPFPSSSSTSPPQPRCHKMLLLFHDGRSACDRQRHKFVEEQRKTIILFLTTTMTTRTVTFSTSTCIKTYEADIDRRSLVWYKSADLKQFKEDRNTDAKKVSNMEYSDDGEKICWWGLERLIVPSVRSQTVRARQQVKQVVLWKQDGACSDERFKEASKWAAQAARDKAMYYSLHL